MHQARVSWSYGMDWRALRRWLCNDVVTIIYPQSKGAVSSSKILRHPCPCVCWIASLLLRVLSSDNMDLSVRFQEWPANLWAPIVGDRMLALQCQRLR
jgi:hypothetical protein